MKKKPNQESLKVLKEETSGNKTIFIKGNVPSLKNGKIKTARGIFSSKTVKKYLNQLGIQAYSTSKKTVKGYVNKPNLIENLRNEIEKYLSEQSPPYEIGFHFVRDSKRKFDFNNANQIIADLFVAHDLIEDDNMDFFIPYALKIEDRYYTVDKENPGVYIKF